MRYHLGSEEKYLIVTVKGISQVVTWKYFKITLKFYLKFFY